MYVCLIYVTISEQNRHMGVFVKVEFYVWLISSTIKLICVQISDCALCLHCDTPPMIEKLQSKGVAMHAYGISVYGSCTDYM